MTSTDLIDVDKLLIDTQNPRLDENTESQIDAIKAIAVDQKEKIYNLGHDIVNHGINPSDFLIVTPNQNKKFIVLEGNRRLATLKILENPNIIDSTITKSLLNKIKKLHLEYIKNPIAKLQCTIFKNREEADHWIELRHTGENKGAGIVDWGATEKARFKQRRSGKKETCLQILDYLQEQGVITPELRSKVPVTSFKRLLGCSLEIVLYFKELFGFVR